MRMLVFQVWSVAMILGGLGIVGLAPILWVERDVIRASELAPTAFASAMGRVADHEVGHNYFTKYDRYQPHVIYFFTAGGRQYRGDRMNLRIRESFSSRARAEKAMSGLPIGTSVRVYYDPTDPSLSTLDTAADFQDYYRFLIVLFCLSVVVAVVGLLGYRPVQRWATGSDDNVPPFSQRDLPVPGARRRVAIFGVVLLLTYYAGDLLLVRMLGLDTLIWGLIFFMGLVAAWAIAKWRSW